MHFMSRFSAICVAALFIGIFSAQSQQDTPAQIKAREALRQQMKALDGQSTNPTPSAVQSPAPVSKPAPATIPRFPPATASSPPPSAVFSSPPPAAAQTPGDSEAIAKARATLRQKLAELDVQAAPSKPAASPKPSAAPATAQTQVKPKEAAEPSKPPKVNSARALPPIAAPAPTISQTKEQQLQELLQLYQMDKISPQDYHERRAKILAAP